MFHAYVIYTYSIYTYAKIFTNFAEFSMCSFFSPTSSVSQIHSVIFNIAEYSIYVALFIILISLIDAVKVL